MCSYVYTHLRQLHWTIAADILENHSWKSHVFHKIDIICRFNESPHNRLLSTCCGPQVSVVAEELGEADVHPQIHTEGTLLNWASA